MKHFGLVTCDVDAQNRLILRSIFLSELWIFRIMTAPQRNVHSTHYSIVVVRNYFSGFSAQLKFYHIEVLILTCTSNARQFEVAVQTNPGNQIQVDKLFTNWNQTFVLAFSSPHQYYVLVFRERHLK